MLFKPVHRRHLFFILGIVLTCFLSRLVFIHTNVFFLDGDEAIVGLMALEIQDGGLPLYFYGQNYGFAFFEALLISLSISIFGLSSLAVKMAMLFLWTTSICLIGLSLLKILKQNWRLASLLTAILIFSPTWLVWSMKARGGYLTSFFLSSFILFLLLHSRVRLKIFKWLIIGVSFGLIIETQPLWAPATFAVIVYFQIYQKRSWTNLLSFACGTTLVLGSLYFVKQSLEIMHPAPELQVLERVRLINDLPSALLNNLGGNYFLTSTYSPDNKWFTLSFLLFSIGLLFYSIKLAVSRRAVLLSSMFLLATLLSCMGFFVTSEPRYLLPFIGFSIFLAAAVLSETCSKSLISYTSFALLLLVLTGAAQLPSFHGYSSLNMSITKKDNVVVDDSKALLLLIDMLKKAGVKYVFTTSSLLGYQLSFLSDNELSVIYRKGRTRLPQNRQKIQKKYSANARSFAFIGFNYHYRYSGKLPLIQNKIYYIISPSKELVEQSGFF